MPISLVTGAPGSGKTYYAVRGISEALRTGRFVATNIELQDDWAEQIARSNILTRLVPGRVARKANEYRRRVVVSADLEELFRVRLQGCGACRPCKRHQPCSAEGRGKMVLDEAHNWINGRTWDVDESGTSARGAKSAAVKRRLAVVRFFSQHRKLGWDVDLITQSAESLDAQVRRLTEVHVRLRNLRRMKIAGIPLLPMNLFLAIHVWNDPAKSILRRELYRLHRRTANLYDTMALSHGLEDDDDDQAQLIHLPHRTAPPRRGTSATATSSVRDTPAVPDAPRSDRPLNGPVRSAPRSPLSVVGDPGEARSTPPLRSPQPGTTPVPEVRP